jgi:hypothetical protein
MVLFPEPEGPTMAVVFPCSILRFSFLSRFSDGMIIYSDFESLKASSGS